MLRHSVAFGLLAAALTLLPEPSAAAPGGFRGGGGVRMGGFRGIPQFRPQFRGPGMVRGPQLVSPRPGTSPHLGPVHPVVPHFTPSVKIPLVAAGAFTYRGSRLVRLDHGRHRRGGLALPVSGYGDFSYFGAPYGPGDAIPVYAPQPLIQQVDADPPADAAPRSPPVLTRSRGADQDACSSEKVTVPAKEGEREITIVRC